LHGADAEFVGGGEIAPTFAQRHARIFCGNRGTLYPLSIRPALRLFDVCWLCHYLTSFREIGTVSPDLLPNSRPHLPVAKPTGRHPLPRCGRGFFRWLDTPRNRFAAP
jgi:hypothetical protein